MQKMMVELSGDSLQGELWWPSWYILQPLGPFSLVLHEISSLLLCGSYAVI